MRSKTWDNGRKESAVASAVKGTTVQQETTLETKLECVSTAPFGSPVVPEVYMTAATSSGRTRAARCSKTPGLISRVERPRSTTCSNVRDPGSDAAVPSIEITYSSAGQSDRMERIFASCSTLETKIARVPLSFRSPAICDPGSVG